MSDKLEFVELIKAAADRMVGGCYFRHIGDKCGYFQKQYK